MKILEEFVGLSEEFYTGTHSKNLPYAEVFKNPTTKEVDSLRRVSEFGHIRGSIFRNNVYIWTADILHDQTYKYFKNSECMRNGLRFVFGEHWDFECSDESLLPSMYKQIQHNFNKLENIYTLNSRIQVTNGSTFEIYGNYRNFKEMAKKLTR